MDVGPLGYKWGWQMEADFTHTLDFYAIKTRRLRVGWSSEHMKKEDIGLKDSHTFIFIHNTHIPSGCLSQGRRGCPEGWGSVTQPWCAGPLSHVVLIFH